jgi:hypothetical protein
MIRLAAAIILATALPLGAAMAETVADTTGKAGLLGAWAVDCATAAAADNPHLEFSVRSGGGVTQQLRFGQAVMSVAVDAAELTGGSTARLHETYLSGFGPKDGKSFDIWLTLTPDHRQYRSMRSIGSDGVVHIEDGIVTATGKQSVAMRKCGEAAAAPAS